MPGRRGGRRPSRRSDRAGRRTLHLPAIREGYEEAVKQALKERATYKDFLAALLTEEMQHRDERRKIRLVREAAFPRPKRIEDFDYNANPEISPSRSPPSATPHG